MPASANDSEEAPAVPGQRLAVAAESMYLANLLLLPGLAFAALLILWFKHRRWAPPLAICHLKQTLSASVWAGVALLLANALIILLGDYTAPATWVIVILYFTICHSSLVLLGSIGLARAMAGKKYVYPLIGRACHE